MSNPTFETERLHLRPPLKKDFKNILWLDSDPEVMRYINKGITVTDPETHKKRIESFLQYIQENPGLGKWMAFEKASDKFIGWVCLQHITGTKHIEIGYRLGKAFWGKGYATEASKALMQHGFETLKLEEIVAICVAPNTASQNVMQKLGLTYDHTGTYYDTEVLFFKLNR